MDVGVDVGRNLGWTVGNFWGTRSDGDQFSGVSGLGDIEGGGNGGENGDGVELHCNERLRLRLYKKNANYGIGPDLYTFPRRNENLNWDCTLF